jgi:hypothetical protein
MADASVGAHPAYRPTTSVKVHAHNPSYQAYQILHFGFFLAPFLAGADKFTHFLVDWDQYLSPMLVKMLPAAISGHAFMLGVGVIEMLAALLVVFKPSIGGIVVAAWLGGIILNLLSMSGYFDIALRDFGLALGAIALSRLALHFEST